MVNSDNRKYKTLVSACVFIFLLAMFLWSENRSDEAIDARVGDHIKVVSISNEISGYAKRAEGHLFLYFLLHKDKDRSKFFKRIKVLDTLAVQLLEFGLSAEDAQTAREIQLTSALLLSQGKALLDLHDKARKSKEGFDTGVVSKEIGDFHYYASKIRKLGVKLVNSSAENLELHRADVKAENRYKYILLLIFSLLAFVFLVVISYQSGKLSSSAKLARTLSELSYLDGLTGVGNRRKFDEEYEKEWKRSERSGHGFSLLMIDVDYFKLYNDHYGHAEGDHCLKHIAQTLAGVLKRPTDLITRYGGEEFAIILPETADGEVVAEACRRAVEYLKLLHAKSEVSRFVTVSIGVGEVFGRRNVSSLERLQEIDKALYQAKEQGRNRVVSC